MSFNETVELERSLLHTLTESVMMCKKYMQTVKEDWFTSDQRSFIFKIAQETFQQSKSMLSEKVYQYEVERFIDQGDHKYYLGEWNLVQGITVTDPVEALMDRLREAAMGRRMMDSIEKVILKAEEGKLVEAVSLFKQSAMMINSGKDLNPLVELTDYHRRLQLIKDKLAHPEKYMGIKTGFQSFDKRTGGLFPQELTLIAGVTGLGKSTLVKQLQKGIIENNQGKNVLHIANEESQIQVETKFDALMTEIPYLDFKLATIDDEDLDRWVDTMEQKLKQPGMGRIFIKEVPAFTDVTWVEQAYRELESQGIPIHVIIIDHLPHLVPIRSAWGENDEKGKAASDCKQLAKDLNCSVVVPTQAATEVEEKQSKGKRAGKLDVYGSKAQIHVANTFVIITDKGKVPDPTLEDWQQDVNWLADVKKNRDGPPFCYRCRHFVRFGKVVEVFDNDEREDNEEKAASAEESEAIAKALQEVDGVKEHVEATSVQESGKEQLEPEPETIMSVLEKMREKKKKN